MKFSLCDAYYHLEMFLTHEETPEVDPSVQKVGVWVTLVPR